ncbi:hypothetical protein R1flu_025709 [Riccia fluitans]|uniref:Uncharacterized protein n=1 Tax=Riccia fluitans TaxID=41844 RepID=A0ABD1XYI9_9MARC
MDTGSSVDISASKFCCLGISVLKFMYGGIAEHKGSPIEEPMSTVPGHALCFSTRCLAQSLVAVRKLISSSGLSTQSLTVRRGGFVLRMRLRDGRYGSRYP